MSDDIKQRDRYLKELSYHGSEVHQKLQTQAKNLNTLIMNRKYDTSAISNISEKIKSPYLVKSPNGFIFRSENDGTICLFSQNQEVIFDIPKSDANILSLWIMNRNSNLDS